MWQDVPPRLSLLPLPNGGGSPCLYDLRADPGEHVDLKHRYPGVVAALVRKLEALEAVAMAPCNVPGGACVKQDPRGLLKAELERAWVPWVKDEL